MTTFHDAASGRYQALLQPFVDRGELAGAVCLVTSAERVLSCEAVGYSDVAAGSPMAPDALFWIASQTKPMVATLLMMLVEEGKVSLDDPVEKYLPGFAEQMVLAEKGPDEVRLTRPTAVITLRQLLNHTSGLPFLSPAEQPHIDVMPLQCAVDNYPLLPLQSQPGSDYAYSNVGINIVGRVVELVSERPFEQFLQERLLDPLGMHETTFWPAGQLLRRLAGSYQPNAENSGLEATPIRLLQYPLDSLRRFASPGGGLFSTAADVARFCQLILGRGEWDKRRFLTEQSVRLMTTRSTAPQFPGYGLGWSTGEGTCGHSGAYSTDMTLKWDKGLAAVFLVQHPGFIGNGGSCRELFQQEAWSAIA